MIRCTISIAWWKEKSLSLVSTTSFESPGGKRNALIRDLIDFGVAGEAKTTSTPTSPTTQAQVTYVSESISYSKAIPKSAWTEKDQIDNFLKERRLMRSLEKFVGGRLYEGDLRLRQKNHMILSYDVLIIQFDESDTHVLEKLNTSAGNPVKEILLKLNLPDHRILKDGGEDKEFQRSFCHSDTELLSRSDEVLKLKNFKKDATPKLFKSTNQERYEHVGPEVTSLQDGYSARFETRFMIGC
ncbi:hypothetical protein Tco_1215345 [Tanacetum coccineum]